MNGRSQLVRHSVLVVRIFTSSGSIMEIKEWVQVKFGGPEKKVFLELGANNGRDTEWMAQIPNTWIVAFEPDQSIPFLARHYGNVQLFRAAIGQIDGWVDFWPTVGWTESGSIRKPKLHLEVHPTIAFGEPIRVKSMRLDTFVEKKSIGQIDFIWADIQGAEVDLIEGGQKALRKTRYLYTEYVNEELYEGEIGLPEILRRLPWFRPVEVFPNDVLLKNMEICDEEEWKRG